MLTVRNEKQKQLYEKMLEAMKSECASKRTSEILFNAVDFEATGTIESVRSEPDVFEVSSIILTSEIQ